MVPGMLRRLAASGIIFDLLVSVVSQEAARELQGILKHHGYRAHAIRVVPNKGRDIGPMFTEFKHELQTYDVIGHFHTKKSPHVVSDARLVRDWVEFLMENLLGGKCKAARSIVDAFAADETLGLVFADDPNLIGWDSNRPFAERFATRLNITLMEDACFAFPVGTMFWARPSALKILFDANLQWDDYPAEPLPIDGTLLHAMERLLPSVVERMGYSRMVTYSPDVRR
jgi:lipopolysaccharide biosynthesis protein